MENVSNNRLEGCISLGPWGSQKDGEPWSYMPNGYLTQITIGYDDTCISSVLFESKNEDTGLVECSKTIGGSGGDKTAKVCIDTRVEKLKSIHWSTVLARLFFDTQTVIGSITFCSTVANYGPFGAPSGGDAGSIPLERGEIVGFHGRAGMRLNSIGIYVVPKSSHFTRVREGYTTGGRVGLMKPSLARDIGPWGSSGGKRWDDGIFARVQQVRFYLCKHSNELLGIQFEYEKADGGFIWSALHGSDRNSSTITISLQFEDFIGIEGYVGNLTNEKNGTGGIRSITLYTDKGKYGPFGVESGKHFMSSMAAGKIVGFWGACGATYINAIGVHMSYF